MKKCSKCKEIKTEFHRGNICKDCRNRKEKEKVLRKSKKFCPVCKSQHVKVAKECSVKCSILNRYDIVNECWEWTGKVGKNGYGTVVKAENGKKMHLLAHRESYKIFKGEIPTSLNVCHTCDNRKCINPDHLWIGTAKDNIQDAILKGRMKKTTGYKHTEENKAKFKLRKRPMTKGELSPLSKLKDQDVIEIRRMIKENITQTDIAKKYGVTQSVISRIKDREVWNHV
jgi:HNH endonuclease